MLLVKAVTIKLLALPESVMPTVKAYTEAFNRICVIGWQDSDHNTVSLHRKTYQQCRTLLPSQLACSARNKASEALKGAKVRIKKKQKTSCPKSKQASIRYDHNSYNLWFDKNLLSISTIKGRQKFEFKTQPCFKQYAEWRRKSAELYVRNNKVMIAIVFEKEVADTKPSGVAIGIDRGVNKLAVTSNNQFFGGGRVKQVVKRYKNLRKLLQSVGSKSAKRHLVRIRNKENRFRRDMNHCISKQIVNSLSQGTTLVLEDLKNIRENGKKFRKEQRYLINGWSFYQLESFLKQKSDFAGCFVKHVDARYTSQKCSKCGHIEKGNRVKQAIFKCKECGFSCNADLNASRNISSNYQDAIGYLGRAEVNQPIVAGTLVPSCKPMALVVGS
jgi:putative transposase